MGSNFYDVCGFFNDSQKNFLPQNNSLQKFIPLLQLLFIQTSLLHVMKNRVGTHFTQKVSCIQKGNNNLAAKSFREKVTIST